MSDEEALCECGLVTVFFHLFCGVAGVFFYVSLVSIFQFIWLTEHDGGYNAEPQSVYLGCFIDSMNRTDLPSKWSLYSVTIDSCLQASYLHGNEYFGLQSGYSEFVFATLLKMLALRY